MSKRNKLLLGIAGTAGVGVAAWRSLFPWFSTDDLKYIRGSNKFERAMVSAIKNRTLVIDAFEEHAYKQPKYPFIIFEDRIYTYGFVNEMANRVANLAGTWNLKIGDTVAMMISNEPSFIWTLLGLQKIGITAAFINYHLTAEPLAHSVDTSGAKILIIGNGDDLLEAIREVKDKIINIPIYVAGKSSSDLTTGFLSLDEALQRSLPVPVCKSVRADVNISTTMCYIYTSGTTGLPKPAIVSNRKSISVMTFWALFDMKREDRVYVVTPLYHSVGTYLGVFNAINFGATVVLKRKFSAHEFFDDCRKYGVTVMQYIGELCRYLLHQPENELDGIHKIRVAFGNGLRPDIWEKFQKRFKIPWIIEFFGATEGIGAFINLSNKPGAIGRFTPITKWFGGQELVKYDESQDQPLRDRNGRCIRIERGEEGLVISPIPPGHTGFYKGPKDIDNKKIVRNAFKDGDAYFNFGDLIYWDMDYHLYFRDRTGDTFRWKGENVSTMEVANVLSGLKCIRDVNVYGVEVPGNDGRAGMAAILLRENQEVTSDILDQIYEHCHHNLASYARPIFLRFVNEIPLTQTMKHRKVELVKEGFDPNTITESLYFLDDAKRCYLPLNSASYNTVLTSKL